MKDRNAGKIALRVGMALILLVLGIGKANQAIAQENEVNGPIYIVQQGDSLWDISLRFGVSLDDLLQANGITNPNQLAAGDRLVIPGLEGIDGILTTQNIPYGETLRSLSRRYAVPLETLVRLNHLTSPSELYMGLDVVIPQREGQSFATRRDLLAAGESLFELALGSGANPWSYVLANHLSGVSLALPGDVLHLVLHQPQLDGSGASEGPGGLPAQIMALSLAPAPLTQGKTVIIRVDGEAGLDLSGALTDHVLHFFEVQTGGYIGLQGVHAMLEPGLYPLTLRGSLTDGRAFAFSQAVFITSGGYAYDPELTVSAETIDPAVTRPEDAQWAALTEPVSPEKYWDGLFQSPLPAPFNDCWPSYFGSRRSYNGSAYSYFHTGLDFCGGVGTDILAPAAGVVVFAGPMTVRGNATIIDHGWGVYTAYLHQSEIIVQAGTAVEAGQVIGKVGGTGRVTGPHLHWEIWAGGVQVDPLDWLQYVFPG